MKKAALLTLVAALSMAAPAHGQALSLLRTLGELGVSPTQAIGGSKALLGIARGNLAPEEFSQLLGSVPQLEQVLDMGDGDGRSVAGALGGLRRGGEDDSTAGDDSASEPIVPVELSPAALDTLMGNADLVRQFTDLGMDASMIGKFAPTLLGLASQGGGASSLGLLRKGLGIL